MKHGSGVLHKESSVKDKPMNSMVSTHVMKNERKKKTLADDSGLS